MSGADAVRCRFALGPAALARRRPNSVVTDFGGYEKGIPVSRMPRSDPKWSPETLLGGLLGGLFEALFLQGLFGLLLCLFLRVLFLCFCHGVLHLCGFETRCRLLTTAGLCGPRHGRYSATRRWNSTILSKFGDNRSIPGLAGRWLTPNPDLPILCPAYGSVQTGFHAPLGV